MKKKIGKQNGSDLVIVERQKTTPEQTNKKKNVTDAVEANCKRLIENMYSITRVM